MTRINRFRVAIVGIGATLGGALATGMAAEAEGGGCTYFCRPCGPDDLGHDIVNGVKPNATSAHYESCNYSATCEAHACTPNC